MKNIKYILLLSIAFIFTSCLVDDENSEVAQGFEDALSVVNFSNANKSLVLTPTSSPIQFSERIYLYGQIPNEGNIQVGYRVNTTETTIASTDYTITNNENDVFTINNNEEVATGTFNFSVNPANITIGTPQYLVIDLVKKGGEGFRTGKMIIKIDICDPAFIGSYTTVNSVGYGGDGEAVEITADCDGNYRGSNIPAFNGTFYFDFTINPDNTLNIDPTGSDVIPLLPAGSTIDAEGSVLPSGIIRFTKFDIAQIGLTGYSFDITPN